MSAKYKQIEDNIHSKRESGLEVYLTENKGRGVFATCSFSRNDFVCEYAGEMISYAEAKQLEKKYALDTSIGCYMYFFEYKAKTYCVDATAESNRLGRLFNHSRQLSNCQTKVFEMNNRLALIFQAKRDISPGEELTIDYGDRTRRTVQSFPWLAE